MKVLPHTTLLVVEALIRMKTIVEIINKIDILGIVNVALHLDNTS
jgi:hypothetical protein